MNYDPERSLWLPSRRKFFFLGLAAGVAPFLPDLPPKPLIYITDITVQFAEASPPYLDPFVLGVAPKGVEAIFLNGEKVDPSRYTVAPNGLIRLSL